MILVGSESRGIEIYWILCAAWWFGTRQFCSCIYTECRWCSILQHSCYGLTQRTLSSNELQDNNADQVLKDISNDFAQFSKTGISCWKHKLAVLIHIMQTLISLGLSTTLQYCKCTGGDVRLIGDLLHYL
jgi:hypothetical protein